MCQFVEDDEECTPLMLLLKVGRIDEAIVELLLDAKANATASDIQGDTALHFVARVGTSELVPRLIEAKARVVDEARRLSGDLRLRRLRSF